MKNYYFVPCYYEWHFICEDAPDEVLLNWTMPEENEDLCKLKSLDEVYSLCEDYIECGRMNFDMGYKDYHGITKEMFDKLPENAANIMATALYNYYVKPFK